MPRKQKHWAIYKGDKFLFMGTTSECAKELNVSTETIRYYGTPAYQRRLEKRTDVENSTIVVDVSE